MSLSEPWTSKKIISFFYWFGNVNYVGKGEGIVIAPHVAGHLLGGTIWKITKDGEDVIYAVDFNHRKERFVIFSLNQNLLTDIPCLINNFNI